LSARAAGDHCSTGGLSSRASSGGVSSEIVGWATGLISGTWMVATTNFQSAIFPFAFGTLTLPGYAALYALAINFAVSIVLSWLLNPIRATHGTDETSAADYRFASATTS